MMSFETFLAPGVAAGVLAVLWFLEGLMPMFEAPRSRLRHDLRNVSLGLLNALILAVLFAGVTLVVTEWARARGVGLLHLLAVPGVVLGILSFLMLDFWQYLWHRLNHRVPLLWRFHAVHHSDADLGASTALRFHTGEIVLSSTARLLVLPLLGVTVGQVLLYELALLPVTLFHHSNVRIPERWDRRLRAVIVTPRMHWVHHSAYRPETDSNYSSVLSVWDRLFRSFRLRRDPERLRLGLDLPPQEWNTLRGMLLYPFRPRTDASPPPAQAAREPRPHPAPDARAPHHYIPLL